jgi:RNA polymerase sigma factor (sigma-70 family)
VNDVMDDFELLQAYVTRGSEAAFAELVDRHVDLVYSAALRQLRDEHAAKDVTQLVFLRLAGKGRTLRRGTVIAGWLYHAVRWVAAEHRRAELRRHRREHLAAEHMNETDDSPDRDQLARVLDDGMAGLSEEERDALVLRFFENKSFRDVGAAPRRAKRASGPRHR